MTNSELDRLWWPLRLTYGLVALFAGADKFLNILTDWDKYLSPAVNSLLPIDASLFMHIAGVIEMAVGLLILTRWTRHGAYIASAWLFCIAANLALSGSFFDVAVRDLAMSVGAWTLARLTEIQERSPQLVTSRDRPAGAPLPRLEEAR